MIEGVELFALCLELSLPGCIIIIKARPPTNEQEELLMTDSRIIPITGYNHLEPGQENNPKPFRTCGAKTRNIEAVYDYCALPAGWGTDHPGAGRCKLHGGSRNPSRYSALWRERMKEIAIQTMETEPDADPLDLLGELEVQRVILASLIDQLPGTPGQQVSEPDDQQQQPRKSSSQVALERELARPPVTSRNKRRKLANELSMGGDGGVVKDADVMVPMVNPSTGFLSSGKALKDMTADEQYVYYQSYWKHVEEIRLSVAEIVGTVTKVVTMRNQTAITRSEVAYVVMLLREGMERFVAKENREPYVEWILANIPGAGKGKVEEE